ncbi:transposase [Paraburkholderia sp. MM6662-R1]
MSMGRSKAQLVLSKEERSQLTSIASSRSISAALLTLARIVLVSVAGEHNSAIAQRLELTRATVGKWRVRLLEHRINGLYDEVRPSKPRSIDDERLPQLIHKIYAPPRRQGKYLDTTTWRTAKYGAIEHGSRAVNLRRTRALSQSGLTRLALSR